MGLRFAKMERKLGEMQRARAIYQHISQFCNPRIKGLGGDEDSGETFWSIWEKFEVYHGDEDTYSDFMRAKRTVEVRYSIANPIITSGLNSKEIKEIEMEQQRDL